ncbi:MAG: hypothetical protein ACE5G8_15110, partial [Anaerolineae bacterium]
MADTLSQLSGQKFSEARSRVFIRSAIDFFRGQPSQLLPFEAVRATLKLDHTRYLGLQDVELDKIVGSVGRYHDFTRRFLPRHDQQGHRWRAVFDLTDSPQGFPPVELYRVGEAYFVRDGNHRVSVARANQSRTIQAYVTEYLTPVDLSADDTMDDVLIKAGTANFLQVTGLDKLRPEQDIRLTNPGRYQQLLRHIADHKYFKEIECACEIPYEQAAASWYDEVYMPLVGEIRRRRILKDFPGRTEADLYAWLVLHRA